MADNYAHDFERRNPDLRAGDSDRDAIADLLREQHLAGRLDTDEFQDRLDRCYVARTYGELEELVVDLPRPEPEPARASLPPPRRWAAVALLPLLIVAIALTAGHLLWLAIPLFFFVGRPLMWRSGGRRGWASTWCGHRASDYV